jgi:hypothetical protein
MEVEETPEIKHTFCSGLLRFITARNTGDVTLAEAWLAWFYSSAELHRMFVETAFFGDSPEGDLIQAVRAILRVNRRNRVYCLERF